MRSDFYERCVRHYARHELSDLTGGEDAILVDVNNVAKIIYAENRWKQAWRDLPPHTPLWTVSWFEYLLPRFDGNAHGRTRFGALSICQKTKDAGSLVSGLLHWVRTKEHQTKITELFEDANPEHFFVIV